MEEAVNKAHKASMNDTNQHCHTYTVLMLDRIAQITIQIHNCQESRTHSNKKYHPRDKTSTHYSKHITIHWKIMKRT